MTVLYVGPDGSVHSGCLEPEAESILLTTRFGAVREPRDVAAILAPRRPSHSERAAFNRAAEVGYRVETR